MHCSQPSSVLDQDRAAITALQNTPQNHLIGPLCQLEPGSLASSHGPRAGTTSRPGARLVPPVALALLPVHAPYRQALPSEPRAVPGMGSPRLWVPPNPNEGVEAK
jgi:hypothetical protein